MRHKLIIYTAIFGDYDTLKPPQCPMDGCDLVCFTDNPELKGEAWNIRVIDTQGKPPSYWNRYYKMLPHRHFPEYERSIYLDGNIAIVKNPGPWVDTVLASHDIAIAPHFNCDCIYQELENCHNYGMISDAVYQHYQALYAAEKIPRHSGLFENNILVRRHNQEDIRQLMEAWWAEYQQYGGRDQLSLFCFLRRAGIQVQTFTGPRRSRAYFRIYPHNNARKAGWFKYILAYITANIYINPGFQILTQCIWMGGRLKRRLLNS